MGPFWLWGAAEACIEAEREIVFVLFIGKQWDDQV